MRKFLLLAFTAMLYVSSFAQDKGFESNVKVRFDAGIDSYKNHAFGAEYIGGYRFNPQIKIGVGAGVSWVNQTYDCTPNDYKEDAVFVPIFLNGKFNFIDGSVSPFFNINVGYSLFVPCSKYAEINHHSVFINPSFGIDVPLDKGAMTFEIGYKYQMRKVDGNALTNEGDCNYSQIEISLGYQF